jgi:hypothetical protein
VFALGRHFDYYLRSFCLEAVMIDGVEAEEWTLQTHH